MTCKIYFSPDKFKCFVRYLIQVAKHKRCVTYVELENIFGLSHDQVGYYAGVLGGYCLERDLPMLNGLIISSSNSVPSEGFDWFQKKYNKTWGEIVSDCWKKFHVTSSRGKQSQDFSKRDADISSFLAKISHPD